MKEEAWQQDSDRLASCLHAGNESSFAVQLGEPLVAGAMALLRPHTAALLPARRVERGIRGWLDALVAAEAAGAPGEPSQRRCGAGAAMLHGESGVREEQAGADAKRGWLPGVLILAGCSPSDILLCNSLHGLQ